MPPAGYQCGNHLRDEFTCQKPPYHGIPHEWTGRINGRRVRVTWNDPEPTTRKNDDRIAA